LRVWSKRSTRSSLPPQRGARSERQIPNRWTIYLQGVAWLFKGITPDYLTTARRLFDRALALDPANVWALIQAAAVDELFASTFLPDDRAVRLATAEAAVTKALSIAPEIALAHLCLGNIQMSTNRAFQSIAAFERALELDRNLANAHHRIGAAKLLLGQPEDTEAHVQESLRLSPRDPFVFVWRSTVGSAKFWLGKELEAVVWLQRSIETNGNYPSSHLILAAALARLGRLAEARSEVRAAIAINPKFTITRFSEGAMSDHPTYLAGRELLIDGLRKAGVPEQ
jgi:tetratricopeptide (TPR) repeat protein